MKVDLLSAVDSDLKNMNDEILDEVWDRGRVIEEDLTEDKESYQSYKKRLQKAKSQEDLKKVWDVIKSSINQLTDEEADKLCTLYKNLSKVDVDVTEDLKDDTKKTKYLDLSKLTDTRIKDFAKSSNGISPEAMRKFNFAREIDKRALILGETDKAYKVLIKYKKLNKETNQLEDCKIPIWIPKKVYNIKEDLDDDSYDWETDEANAYEIQQMKNNKLKNRWEKRLDNAQGDFWTDKLTKEQYIETLKDIRKALKDTMDEDNVDVVSHLVQECDWFLQDAQKITEDVDDDAITKEEEKKRYKRWHNRVHKDAMKIRDTEGSTMEDLLKFFKDTKEYFLQEYGENTDGGINQVIDDIDLFIIGLESAIELRRIDGRSTKYTPRQKQEPIKEELFIREEIKVNDTLNPLLFQDNKLKPEVKEKINDIVDEFLKGLQEDNIQINVDDIELVGSNVNYNYTKDSDLDVHIIANVTDCPGELYPLLYSAYRSIWNKNIDIDFYGIPVELYVDTENQPKSNGIYSVTRDEWIKEPVREEIPNYDKEEFDRQFKELEDKYFNLINQ